MSNYARHNNKRRYSKHYTSNRSRNKSKRNVSTLDPRLFISREVKVEKNNNSYIGEDFASYNLSREILKNLEKKGFGKTTKIQEAVISKILEGKDVFAISQTGSGKTGAFLIPIIEKLLRSIDQKALVIAPTRELAKQIVDEVRSLTIGTRINAQLIVGGESIYNQMKNLRRNPQIVVGTPGRLKDIHARKGLDYSTFNNFVLDEVDRMLDMGFVNEIKEIYYLASKTKQSMFFSATTDKRVENIVKQMAQGYEYIQISENKPTKSVYQDIVIYDNRDQKIPKLNEILSEKKVEKTLVFVETKHYADRVEKALYKSGFKSGVIHGGKKQNQRKKILSLFRDSRINVLVATNVAARGIDITDITHVINLDTPVSYDDYIHRIGRAGRNGNTGTALTFVSKF